MIKALSKLKKQLSENTDDEGNENTRISYLDIIETLDRNNVTDIEVFENIRQLLIAELAHSTSFYLDCDDETHLQSDVEWSKLVLPVTLYSSILSVIKKLRQERVLINNLTKSKIPVEE